MTIYGILTIKLVDKDLLIVQTYPVCQGYLLLVQEHFYKLSSSF